MTSKWVREPIRHLVLVLGDQLNTDSVALHGFDPQQDAIWMAEVAHESTKVWSGKPRTVLFLSAMRHFRDALRARGWRVFYRELSADAAIWNEEPDLPLETCGETFAEVLAAFLQQVRPQWVIFAEPGEWQVRVDIEACLTVADVEFEVREDRHFLCTHADFDTHAAGRRQLRMEYFYREMRVRHDVLMDNGKPAGGG
ncbi:MAG: cryptochrome/photolyase family protein, partial [Dokdonella sp.]